MPQRQLPSADARESPRLSGPAQPSETGGPASDPPAPPGGNGAAVSYRLRRTVAIVHACGRYTPSELAAAVGAVLDDAVARPLHGIVLDMRNSQSFAGRSQTDVEQLTQYMGRRCAGFGGRVGVIPPAHAPGPLVRLVSGCFADRGVAAHIFREPSTAVQWLRRPAVGTEDQSDREAAVPDQDPAARRG